MEDSNGLNVSHLNIVLPCHCEEEELPGLFSPLYGFRSPEEEQQLMFFFAGLNIDREKDYVGSPLGPLQFHFPFSTPLLAPSNNSLVPMENNPRNSNINEIKSTLTDIKIHLCRVYEMVCTGVKENKILASDVKYLSNQMGFHESRIDDNDRDLRELMGTIHFIKVEVHKMSNMNHCSYQ